MRKECRVVMLPTEKASHIYHVTRTNKLGYVTGKYPKDLEQFPQTIIETQNQHLYILSDDEIKEERLRWIMDNREGMNGFIHQVSVILDSKLCPEIIATTDSSLCSIEDCPVRGAESSVKYILPQPSQSFIQKYIDAYNSGKSIEKVMVEYSVMRRCVKCKATYIVYACTCGEQDNFENQIIPKINPKDNTITISKVKDSWTREEVGNLLNQMRLDLDKSGTISNEEFIRWIEENL